MTYDSYSGRYAKISGVRAAFFLATKKKFWVSAEQFGPDDLSFLLLHWIELIAGYKVTGSDFGEKFQPERS